MSFDSPAFEKFRELTLFASWQGIHRPLVLRKASKKRKRVASAPPRRSKVSEDCVARVSMAASCFCFGHEKDGQDRVEKSCGMDCDRGRNMGDRIVVVEARARDASRWGEAATCWM